MCADAADAWSEVPIGAGRQTGGSLTRAGRSGGGRHRLRRVAPLDPAWLLAPAAPARTKSVPEMLGRLEAR
jgi:hypothetical protein